MWHVVLRSAGMEPQDFVLQSGSISIGRDHESDLIVNDPASSREHALLTFNENEEILTLYDLESTNGTFVNQQKICAPFRLSSGDRIRIGSSLLVIQKYANNGDLKADRNQSSYTRELLSHDINYHAALMSEVAHKLKEESDISEALHTASTLMEYAMGADKCIVIQAKHFENLENFQIPTEIAHQVFEKKGGILFPDRFENITSDQDTTKQIARIRSAICMPVLLDNEIIALIYLEKVEEDAGEFGRDDLHLVLAISHQLSLTINRISLVDTISEETKIKQTLLRFVSHQEMEYLLTDVLSNGQLPGLSNQNATILLAELSSLTKLAEKLGTKEIGDILKNFYLDVSNIVFKFNGIVRFLTAGALAIFLSDGSNAAVSKVAINAGLEILKYIESSQLPISVGVTIASGEVVAGYVGNDDRVEFFVFGNPVEVAHGIQSFARPNRLIVGAEIIESIQGSKGFHSKPIPSIKLENPKGLVDVFEIMGQDTIGIDTMPVSRMRKGTSELIEMLPQRLRGDLLFSE